MPRSVTSKVIGLALLGISLVLSGCTGGDKEPVSVVGETLDVARKFMPEGGLVIYDLSYPILGLPSTYTDGELQTAWLVVVHCHADHAEALGVIPVADNTPEILDEATAGEFNQYLVECPGYEPPES